MVFTQRIGRFGDPDAGSREHERPVCQPPEERLVKRARSITDEDVNALQALRKEVDLSIQYAAQQWPKEE